MTNHERITKEFGRRWADMVFGKGEFERNKNRLFGISCVNSDCSV